MLTSLTLGDLDTGLFITTYLGYWLVGLMMLAVGIFAFGGLYRRSTWELDEIRRIVGGVALIGMFDATLQFAFADHTSRLWALVAYPMVAQEVDKVRR